VSGDGTLGEPAVVPIAAGERPISGYEVIDLLSRGRRLDVYDAWSDERESRCVLKMLRPERRDDEEAAEKLVREGALLAQLTHPHIVRAYETVYRPDPVVVLETLAGETLGHMFDTRPPLSPAEAAHLGLQLSSAVSYLHKHGYLHLDLKPDNVVAESGRAKVIDLSLARPPGPTPPGYGTWCYLSPEQARGDQVDASADTWGIGIILWEALSGEIAIDDPGGSRSTSEQQPSWETGGDDDSDEHYPQIHEPIPSLGHVTGLRGEVVDLVDRCLLLDPAERPSLSQLAGGLERIAELPENERRHNEGSRG
jgi:eukaryotic-like serine/threonine-protein kinase